MGFEDLERQIEHEYGKRKSAVSGWSDKPKKCKRVRK
jgi:hypothetical protein